MSLLGLERARLGWWVLGLALGGALVFVVHAFIGTFVFGVFLYYATRPIYRRLRRRIRPPSLAAAVSLFALALPALLLVLYAFAIVIQQAVRYTNSGLFDLSQYPIDQELLDAITDPERLLELDLSSYLSAEVIGQLTQSLSSAVDTIAFFGVGAVHLFVMIALAFYLLRDDRRLTDWAVSTFGDGRGVVLAYGTAVDHDLKAVFFGNILNAVLTGTIGVIAYTVLNVFAPASQVSIPAAALVGLLAGVASIIPVVGMKLVYVPVALYMAVVTFFVDPQLLWFVLVFVAVSFVVVDTIPDLVLRPYVSGRSLHVGSVMIAYTFGPLLFGWYGIFLMPMLLVLVFHFARIVLPELVRGEDIRPFAVDPGVEASVPAVASPEPPVSADGEGPTAHDASGDETEPASEKRDERDRSDGTDERD
ncbi:AI-2E family transporter [Salinigranum halophilum]|uniref:AI-2E family transporter n=1 Tax=Salinigranum halophilum TaxID=2565931 RepID=UPI0010A925B1|nr:AI-2E family transporter [Salinigranum halophilum]